MKPGLRVAVSAALAYAVLGLFVLDPETLLSVDAAVKLLQAYSLLQSGLRSVSIHYPAAVIDPAFAFFPFASPFVFKAGGAWQGVFSSGVALFNAVWLPLGVQGVVLASAIAGGVTLAAMSAVRTPMPSWLLPLVLGIGTNFWFYCVLPWEHVPALAFSSAAWAMLFVPPRRRALIVCAIAFGVAVVLREETLLLLPGFLWALWTKRHRLGDCAAFMVLLALPLAVLSLADVTVLHRPPAAHLAHVSELLAGSVGEPSNIPVRDSWPPIQRAETVLQEWLLGRAGWAYTFLILALVTVLGCLRRHAAASLGVLVLAMLSLVQLGQDLLTLLPHPDFVPGLLRLSPVLVFAAVPLSAGSDPSLVRRQGLLMCGGYLLCVLATLSTTGGASLGPRLLLPILPVLCHAACEGLWSYRPLGPHRTTWPIWEVGLLLLAGSIVVQVGVAMRAYVTFNVGERRAVELLRESKEEILVIDSAFTMSVTEPLYLSRNVVMSDSQPKAQRLGALLKSRSIPSFLLVSRELTQPFDFAPYRLASATHFPRTIIQRWALPPRQ